MSRFEEFDQEERDLFKASLDVYKKKVNPNPEQLEKIDELQEEIKEVEE